MTLIEYARLVKQMRDFQKTYFRTRTDAALSESKALERRLDEATAEILGGKTRDLFGEAPRAGPNRAGPQDRGA